MARQICSFLKNRRELGKNEAPFWRFFQYEYTELKIVPKNEFYKDLELAEGRNFKWNYDIFAAKILIHKLFVSNSKILMYLLWLYRVVLNFLLKWWGEVAFFVVQVVLVLTLQATLRSKRQGGFYEKVVFTKSCGKIKIFVEL